MKVVRVIARLNVGGPAQHVVWLTRAMAPLGFETTLVCGTVPPGEQDMSYVAVENGVEPQLIPEMSRELSWRDGVVVWRLFRMLLRERPDVVHTHTAKAGAVGRSAAILYNLVNRLRPGRTRALILHTYHGHVFHGYYGTAKTKVFLAIERLLARFTDRILVLTEQQRSEIHETFRVGRAGQFAIVPLGLDLSSLRAGVSDRVSARTQLGVPADAFAIAIVGRVTAIKNHPLFLAAVARLVEAEPNVALQALVVGDGDTRIEAERQTAALNLGNVVRFLGAQKSMATVYSAIDALVLTSLNEGTPLAIIEAMVCGRPVVATAVGGVGDLLGPAASDADDAEGFSIRARGILVTRFDPASVAGAIRRLRDDRQLCARLVSDAERYASETFSIERLARDVAAVYNDALSLSNAR